MAVPAAPAWVLEAERYSGADGGGWRRKDSFTLPAVLVSGCGETVSANRRTPPFICIGCFA